MNKMKSQWHEQNPFAFRDLFGSTTPIVFEIMLDGIVGLFFGGGLFKDVFITFFIPLHTCA